MSELKEKLKKSINLTLMGYQGKNLLGLSASIDGEEIHLVSHFINEPNKSEFEDIEIMRSEVKGDLPEISLVRMTKLIGNWPPVNPNLVIVENYDGRQKDKN